MPPPKALRGYSLFEAGYFSATLKFGSYELGILYKGIKIVKKERSIQRRSLLE
jgi:hypothetical protein